MRQISKTKNKKDKKVHQFNDVSTLTDLIYGMSHHYFQSD